MPASDEPAPAWSASQPGMEPCSGARLQAAPPGLDAELSQASAGTASRRPDGSPECSSAGRTTRFRIAVACVMAIVFDAAFAASPHETLARLRRHGSVHRVTLPSGLQVWLVTGHAEVREALTDPRISSAT